MKLKTKDEIIIKLLKQLKKESTLYIRTLDTNSHNDGHYSYDDVERLFTVGEIKALEWVLGIDKKGETEDVQE